MMTPFPQTIGLQKWSDTPFSWQGSVTLTELPRLMTVLDTKTQIKNDPVLVLELNLHQRNGVLWLDFAVQGRLWLSCDRCLETLSQAVTGTYSLAIIGDEREVALVGEAEYVTLDELGTDKVLPVAELLQDELLLGLPLTITHKDCQLSQTHQQNEEKASPFAVLATLKSSSSPNGRTN